MLGIEATINQHIAFITPKSTIVIPEFLHLALMGAYKTLRALSEDSGSTKGALTCEDLKRFKLALPPPPEQEKLVEEIRVATVGIETAITRAQRQIDLIREYRTRLTTDVVTGKLDVREAASKLPADEEPETPASEEFVEEEELEPVTTNEV